MARGRIKVVDGAVAISLHCKTLLRLIRTRAIDQGTVRRFRDLARRSRVRPGKTVQS